MGAENSVSVHCPICKHKHQVPAVRVVDVSRDGELRKRYESGELFQFDCPDCGYRMKLGYSYMYQDPGIREFIYLSREQPAEDGYMMDQVVKNATAMAGGKKEDSILRIVFSESDLQEKIKIFENGLDDRIVELCKGIALSQFPATEEFFVTGIHYDVVGGKELLKLTCSDGTEEYALNFPEMYGQMFEEYSHMLPPLRGNIFSCIDLEYAASFLRETIT